MDVDFFEIVVGEPITQGLSDYIRAYSDKDDRADVSREFKVSTSTIRDVVYRKNRVSTKNESAMYKMTKIAFLNASKNLKSSIHMHEEVRLKLNL